MAALPGAQIAWLAYEAMTKSKQQHLVLLQGLEQKYARFGSPNDAEQTKLARLLAHHDEQVKRFKASLDALRNDDPEGYAEVLQRLRDDA